MTNVGDTDDQGPRAAYDKDHEFDLEVGMSVHGPGGEMIGRVTSVQGFGSTRLGATPDAGRDDRVTQARGGTGFFKVNRSDSPGGGDLVVPFNGIESVTSDGGVILSADAMSNAVRAGQAGAQGAAAAQTEERAGRRRWPFKKG